MSFRRDGPDLSVLILIDIQACPPYKCILVRWEYIFKRLLAGHCLEERLID